APPVSPVDGEVYILGPAPTGAWAGFMQHDVVMWRDGTWMRFLPFTGWLKQVGTEVRRYSGAAWEIGAEPSGAAAAAVAAHVAAADPHPQYLTPTFVHTQGSASATWTVNHNLGFRPSVEVFSVGGAEIDAAVLHTSVNQTVISFNTATAGSARLI
ncbi:MAG TPA: DUF2793 domain-containing protein, partial [Coriobacteriia bacterium]|nr:DUF2793 domain-containing protein [Coriobacteriia bacterium]